MIMEKTKDTISPVLTLLAEHADLPLEVGLLVPELRGHHQGLS